MGLHPKVIRKFNPLKLVASSFSQSNPRFNYLSFVALVLAPFALASLYYALYASDRYASQTKVLVRMTKANGSEKIELSLLGGGMGGGFREPLHVREFILSHDMLNKIDQELKFREHVSSSKVDLFSRLPRRATKEEFFDYYRKRIRVVFDELSGVLNIEVDCFSPQFAREVLNSIVKNAELFLNESSHRLAREQMEFVEKELDEFQNQLRDAKERVTQFQSQHRMVSPQAQVASLSGAISQLTGELIKEEATLRGMLSYMDERAIEVVQSRQKIAALRQQITSERTVLAGNRSSALTELQSEFQKLELDLEFKLNRYKVSLAALEQARIESYRKLAHLVVIDSPTLPQEALYPKKLYNLATLFVMLAVIYGLVVMIAATVREHK